MKLAHCIECGCHDLAACHDEATNGPCSWLELDRSAGAGVCSACPHALVRWNAGDREFTVQGDHDGQDLAHRGTGLYGKTVFLIPPAATALSTVNPIQGACLDSLVELFDAVAGGNSDAVVLARVRQELAALISAAEGTTLLQATQALERVPELQEFAASIRAGTLPGAASAWFDQAATA